MTGRDYESMDQTLSVIAVEDSWCRSVDQLIQPTYKSVGTIRSTCVGWWETKVALSMWSNSRWYPALVEKSWSALH